MLRYLNFKYILSYLGLVPLIIIIIDNLFINNISKRIEHDFIIYYLLMIFVFIGASNWDLTKSVSNYLIIYGFLPSLFTTILIIFNLYLFKKLYILYLILFLIWSQLICDYLVLYRNSNYYNFFNLRLPLTISLTILTFFILAQ